MEQQKTDIYEAVNGKIIAQLESGNIPWKQSWSDRGLPKNLLTQKPYRGVNVLLLNSLGFAQNYFLSFEQVKAVGGSVRKGEKSQIVVFWKRADTNNPDQTPSLRCYPVFNVAQCTDLPMELIHPIKRKANPITACERIIKQMPNKPIIEHWENRAFYNVEYDIVNVPDIEYFVEKEAYYATLIHQLVSCTGSEGRLNRKDLSDLSKFGNDQFTTEALIAEIGGGYLQSQAGINYNEIADRDTYIQGWIGKLRHEKGCIIYASNQAQKAVDYILNVKGDTVDQLHHSEKRQSATV